MQNTARLPGVVFQVQPRQPETVLPRMDIAAFVGFAASGPLHTPVPVEDKERFRELFGADLMIAWDEERRAPENSLLGDAVESFFRNGGRRCWIVRVGHSDMPYQRFKLNGLVPAGLELFNPRESSNDIAEARARSPGHWADEVSVNTVLSRERLPHESFGFDGQRYELFVRATLSKLRVGELLEIVLGSEQPTLYLFLDSIETISGGVRLSGKEAYWYQPVLASPPASEQSVWELIHESRGLDALGRWRASESPEPSPSIYLLRFAIYTHFRGNKQWISELAFHRDHPRAWMRLPDDAVLFRRYEGRIPPTVEPAETRLREEAALPRFPLAGPEKPLTSYLPIGMPSTSAELHFEAEPIGGEIDNDIASFSSDLFFEDAFKQTQTAELLREAEHRYYLAERSLRGFHSLLPIEEVTLISVPDAVHRNWHKEIRDIPDIFPAPYLDKIPSSPDTSGKYRITWSTVSEATAYRLQYDRSVEFSNPVTIDISPDVEPGTDLPDASTAVSIDLDSDCPAELRFFRVRALRDGFASAWSGTRGGLLTKGDFKDCLQRLIDEIHLNPPVFGSPPGNDILLHWNLLSDNNDGPDHFELQLASDMEFAAVQVAYTGLEPQYEFKPRSAPEAPLYFRVRALRGDVPGPWSNTVNVNPQSLQIPMLESSSEYDDGKLLAIHRALICFCAARGDVWACLSLPRHYRRLQILNHLNALSTRGQRSPVTTAEGVPPLSFGEANALSYAGLFHPWLGSRRDDILAKKSASELVSFGPPDGSVLGWMARQAITQGAWYAPANEPFRDVIALDPPFSDSDWRELTLVGVNLVRPDPRGMLLQNAETLFSGSELHQINVRRLLILLHRLALREGRAYVFEPNSTDFRGLVQHRFERLLSQLYVRGAFAGSTPAAGYRVVVDESVNPRQSLEQGRFVIELRVAPSQPLQFITIRLIQTGSERFELEEV